MAVELLVEQVPQTQASSSHLLRASSSQPRRYHKTASYTMACKALHASNFPFKMRCWGILGERRIGLVATKLQAAKLNGAAQAGADLERAVRDYVRTYAVLHGKSKAAEALGVSRHTLWRFLNRGHTGRAIPRAVLERVAGSAEALDDAEERLILQAQARRRLKDGGPVAERRTPRPLREGLEDTLRLLRAGRRRLEASGSPAGCPTATASSWCRTGPRSAPHWNQTSQPLRWCSVSSTWPSRAEDYGQAT